MMDLIIRMIGVLLIAIGMFWLGKVSTFFGFGIGLLLVIGTIVTLFPSIFSFDDRE